MSEEEEDDLVTFGTALPEYEDDEVPSKPTPYQEQAVKDSRGRYQRFHGAFTGGFSAGYFNSVGTKEGWTPSTFVSSKGQKGERQSFNPEDFMDEEDLGEHGIAPKRITTTSPFEEARKRRADALRSAGDTGIIAGTVLEDLIIPARIPMGIKLLRKMGWKDGQGIGARVKKKIVAGKKTYGCAMPPGVGDNASSEDSEDEYAAGLSFAPKDVTPINFKGKDDVHGLGYSGINPRSALGATSGHFTLFDEPSVTRGGKKGIKGHAFGIGALEVEEAEDNVYSRDDMSKYDFALGGNEKDQLHGWTAPRQRAPQSSGIPGFGKSGKMSKEKKIYHAPELPRNFKPIHRPPIKLFRQPEGASGGAPGTSETQKPKRLTASERSEVLGETPHYRSVFDLIPDKDKDKLEAVKKMPNARPSGTPPAAPQAASTSATMPSSNSAASTNQGTASARNSTTSTNQGAVPNSAGPSQAGPSNPLFRGAVGGSGGFKPFASNPEKQKRYEHYLDIKRQGKYGDEVPLGSMTEWEREREQEEFSRASALYKPLSFSMASRFTSAQFTDDTKTVELPAEQKETSDQAKAAEMKMFGKLTRETFEWHPDKTLCKRFNIKNPYPDSTIVGVPKVLRDKYSVFNFLSNPTAAEVDKRAERAAQEIPIAIEAPPEKSTDEKNDAATEKPRLDFSLVMTEKTLADREDERQAQIGADPPGAGSTGGAQAEEESRPPMDLFRAIFADSDDSSSSSDDDDDDDDDPELDRQNNRDTSVASARNPIEPTVISTTAQLSLDTGNNSNSATEINKSVAMEIDKNPGDEISERQATSSGGKVSSAQPNTNTLGDSDQFAQNIRDRRSRWTHSSDMDTEQRSALVSDTGGNTEVSERLAPSGGERLGPSGGERLTPSGGEIKQEKLEDEAGGGYYGPSLPPPILFKKPVKSEESSAAPSREEHRKHKHKDRDSSRERHRDSSRDSSREKHKHKKKKSKHKKEKKSKKQKEKKKKSKKHRRSSTSEESQSDTGSESDNDPAADLELLNRLKSVPSNKRPSAADFF